MVCYNGHGVEFGNSLHALLTTPDGRSLFPMETMLNRIAKTTNVFAIFNCNRMHAYGRAKAAPRPDLYVRESRVNFLYAAREGDEDRACDLSQEYFAQAEDNLLLPSSLTGAVDSVVSIPEEKVALLNDQLKQALFEFESMGDPACLEDQDYAQIEERRWAQKL